MGVSWLDLDMRSASIAAAALVSVAVAGRPARRRWSDLVAAGAIEAALVCGLFALWQLANSVAHHHVAGGLANGTWIWNAERWLHVPSETWFQGLVLPHPTFGRRPNHYYATAPRAAALDRRTSLELLLCDGPPDGDGGLPHLAVAPSS